MSGSNSITWKCSTDFTDLSEAQFLNQMTYFPSASQRSHRSTATNMIQGHFRERIADICVDLGPRRISQVPRGRVFLEGKLGPDDEVHDALVDPIRPVISQHLDVVVKLKRPTPWRDWQRPLQSL